MNSLSLKSYEFRREREAAWRELEELVTRIEKKGVKRLSSAELARLPLLYRATLSSLSVARSISLDQNVLDYLESLAGRAYFCIYGTRSHLRHALADFFGRRFPRSVRRHRWAMFLSAALLVLGAVTAFVITARDQDRFYTFVQASYADGRGPSASTEELRAVLFGTGDGASGTLGSFASFLFTHNAKIGIVAFALGFALGIPVFLLIFVNGLTLGAFAALYDDRGLSVEFWSWILPHGITEMTAVVLCGGGGLVLAHSIVFPGRHRRRDNLALKGRDAGQIVLGAVVMFFIAALIEGIFRQTVQSVPIRYAVAGTSLVLLALYFSLAGRGAQGDP